MAITAGISSRAIWLGALVAVLTALACLTAQASRDAPTISLAELAALNAPLMSCEGGSGGGGGEAVMWCSDPNSPHCLPAAPEPPPAELGDRPDLDMLWATAVAPAAFVVLPWPEPAPTQLRARRDADRLERPPRA